MRSIKLLLIILTASFLLNGCDEQDVPPTVQWTWEDTDNSFEEIELTPGTTLDVILQTPEPPYEYAFSVVVPEIIDEVNGNPLVFSMHGGVGGAGREAHKTLGVLHQHLKVQMLLY